MLDLSPLTMLETNCFIALLKFLEANKRPVLWGSQLVDFDAGIPRPFVSAALNSLVDKGFLTIDHDSDGDRFWTITPEIASDAYEFWLDDYDVEKLHQSRDIPAADRFVPINHNSPDYREAQETLERLEEVLTGANDLFANAEERLAVVSEVQGIRAALNGRSIRASTVAAITRSSGTLSWLATEAFSGTIRALASKAVEYFVRYVFPGTG